MFMTTARHDEPCAAPADEAPQPCPMTLHGPDDAQRGEIEQFIADVYARRFGARVQHFAPTLVSVRDVRTGRLVAAAGYRRAADGPLFLERYLDAPIETVLARHGLRDPGTTAGAPHAATPARAGIVEIGHLAGIRPGEGRRLIFLLAPWLVAHGFRWASLTLTRELHHLFLRLGLSPLTLGPADPTRLQGAAADWGSYYAHEPMVLAGDLGRALATLNAGGRRKAGAA